MAHLRLKVAIWSWPQTQVYPLCNKLSASAPGLTLNPKYLGVSQIRVPFLGVPIIRTIVHWGLYWGPLFRETTI